MTEIVLESPLVGVARLGKRELHVDNRSCWLDELPLRDLINLRGNPRDAGFAQAVQQATGLALPVQANSASRSAERQLLWLGPDEWLLKLPLGQGDAVEAALRAALAGSHFSAVQVGSGYTTLSLHGPAAADLLARGCPLDLHARAFPDGALAQSHMAKANIVVLCLQAEQNYELTVRRSFAEYVFLWLCEAGR